MQTISKKYQQLICLRHNRYKHWGVSAGHWLSQVREIVSDFNVDTVLDYGAGKGILKKNLKGVSITEYDPGILEKASKPKGEFSFVTCIDVLEHIEPEYIDNVLWEIYNYTGKVGFFTISLIKSRQKFPDGNNVHVHVKDKNWWLKKLQKYFIIKELEGRNNKNELVIQVMPKISQSNIFKPVVLCMLWGKWGGQNPLEYVYKLKNMVGRNTTIEHDFMCLNDFEESYRDGIHFVKMPGEATDMPLNLPKFYMHQAPELLGKRIIFFDLDMIIVSNIDVYLKYNGYFAGIEPFNPRRKNDYISGGILGFSGGTTNWLYERVKENPQGWANKTQGGKERFVLAELEKESAVLFDRWQRILPKDYMVISYKRHIVQRNYFPKQTNVIAFHGNPRPHELPRKNRIKKLYWK